MPFDKFREMDFTAFEKKKIPIELMIKNAGLQLGRNVAFLLPECGNVVIGVDTGNSGAGGLVEASCLFVWG